MTSSSTDPAVLRVGDDASVRAHTVDTELRTGTWTRLGGSAVLGDRATEAALTGLAETARAAARAQGYATGWAEGRRAAEEQTRDAIERDARERAADRERQAAEHAAAMAALEGAAQQLRAAVEDVAGTMESAVVELALQISEAVLGREVATSADPGADAVRRALRLLPDGAIATVHLNPEDRARLDPSTFGGLTLRLVDDPTLARGDALVETDQSVVDATMGAALARVREVLAP